MDSLKNEWKNAMITYRRNGSRIIFKEQKQVADKILKLFSLKILVTLIAPPQWGKTSVSLCVAYKLCIEKKINPDNVFFITAMSDRSWIEQTRGRVLPVWKENIYHRNTLHKLCDRIKGNDRNIFIIVDECHLANHIDHTLGKVMDKLNIKHPKYMKQKNIKILQISATPSNALVDAVDWNKYHSKICPSISEGYISFQDFINGDHVLDPLCLESYDGCAKYIDFIESHSRTESNGFMYHFVRSVCNGPYGKFSYNTIFENLQMACFQKSYDIIELNMKKSSQEIKDIYKSLSYRPKQHTIILIKNMLGASKTLDDTFIGSIHESTPMKKNYNSEVQGLPGRLCGWSKKKGCKSVVLFCDRNILEEYIKLYDSSFNYKGEDIIWNDPRLKVMNGEIKSKESYLSL